MSLPYIGTVRQLTHVFQSFLLSKMSCDREYRKWALMPNVNSEGLQIYIYRYIGFCAEIEKVL